MDRIIINPAVSKGTISKNIYGHFAEHLGRCIYQGLFVGRDSSIPHINGMRKDVVDALRHIQIPVLRWPGGCFADAYHWEDGIGPQAQRKRMVNTHWGGVVEDNSFGTHEFMELCEQLGCEPYINANMGSGTIREMADWVEYLNSDGDSSVAQRRWANGRKEPWTVRYWGIGNESWGCGGNMLPEYYTNEYRRYQTYCRKHSGKQLYKIACGPNAGDYFWTDVLMRQARQYADAITLHYYTTSRIQRSTDKGSATKFSEDVYYATLSSAAYMEELITRHLEIMDRYDPDHRVGLIVDEWGTWFNVEPGTNPGFLYQQNTMRDAMVAAISLDIFNQHCDRVVMANLAQTVNVLQAVILTEGDRMVLTPTYHVFDLYKAHHDARALDCFVQCDCRDTFTYLSADQQENRPLSLLTASASEKDGIITVTTANVRMTEADDVMLVLPDAVHGKITARILTGEAHQFNDFDDSPLEITPFDTFEVTMDGILLHVPACSVVEVRICVDNATDG